MIGHNNHSSYRPRGSNRRYFWILFVLFVLFLWQFGAFTPKRAADSEAASEPFAQKSSQGTNVEDVIGEKSPLELETNVPNPKLESAEVVDLESPYAISSPIPSIETQDTLAHHAGLTADAKSASKAKLNFEEDAEEKDVDEIEQIGNHHEDEILEHASKLTHPDDDDGDMSETELKASRKDSQVRLPGTEDISMDAEGEESTIGISNDQTAWSKDYTFPSWDACEEIQEKADGLPDLLHVPFEVTVRDVVLEGWEDEWIAKAQYSGPKLEEPKIDFVYNCKYIVCRDAQYNILTDFEGSMDRNQS